MCAAGSYERETPADLQQNGALGVSERDLPNSDELGEMEGVGEGWNDSAVIFSTRPLWVITVILALGPNPMT